MQKTFILGVGAQKAGTTWLHGQLSRSESINFGFRKEYHVFDVIEALEKSVKGKHPVGRYEKIINSIATNCEGSDFIHQQTLAKPLKHALLELAFIKDTSIYFNYFINLAASDPKYEAVGDITPSYALLNKTTLLNIKSSLEESGLRPRVIFLMRDPIERIWSSARMKKRELPESSSKNFDEFKLLKKLPKNHSLVKKSDYQQTIRNLESAFDPSQIYYGFYESLFQKEFKNKLQQFLGLPLKDFDNDQVFNASPKSNIMPLELREKLLNMFSETYAFCADRFGSQVTDVWSGYSS